MSKQYLYHCPDPRCPVVTFVDRVNEGVDPTTNNACPDFGTHPGMDDGVGVLIGPWLDDMAYPKEY